MAIATVDGFLKGALPPIIYMKSVGVTLTPGYPINLTRTSGLPGLQPTPTATASGIALSGNQPGFFNWNRATTGKTYLTGLNLVAHQPGTFLLCDQLWLNMGMSATITTPQTVDSIPWPARDKNFSTLGEDVFVGVMVYTAPTAGTPTLSINYTASDGTTGNTASNVLPTLAAAGQAGFYFLNFAGKKGVRSVQTFTVSSTWTTAFVGLVAYRILYRVETPLTHSGFSFCFPEDGAVTIPNDSCPFFLFIPSTATSGRFMGAINLSTG